MNKILTITTTMLGLIFSFFCSGQSYPLTVGDKLPDVKLSMFNYAVEQLNTSDLCGKPVLIDFWATWCAPCVSLLPKMDSIQRLYKDKLVILPVTREDKKKVQFLFDKITSIRKIQPVSVINDSLLHKLFPFRTYPHYVWIDKYGIIRAITFIEDVNKENIEALIAGKSLNLTIKKDSIADITDSATLPPNIIMLDTTNLAYCKLLAGYKPGRSMTIGWKKNYVSIQNLPVTRLFQTAYAEGDVDLTMYRNPILLTKDSLLYYFNTNWSQEEMRIWNEKHNLCYDIRVPLKDSAILYKLMQQDIENYFPLTAKKEFKKQKILALVTTGTNELYKSKGEKHLMEVNQFFMNVRNLPAKSLFFQFNHQLHTDFPILNETGYSGNFDLTIIANLRDIPAVRKELQKWGLDLIVEERDIPVIVIKDRPIYQSSF